MGKSKGSGDAAVRYSARVGFHYATAKGERRAEIGDVVTDLPASSIDWMLDNGYIAEAPAPVEIVEG